MTETERQPPNTDNVALQTTQAGSTVTANDTIAQFCTTISKYFTKDEIASFIRITNQGLFIDERLAGRLVEQFEIWLQAITGNSLTKSPEKIWRKLFGSELPNIYYILEGKQCGVGYLVPGDYACLQKQGLLLYRGNPLDATSYLHERDPLFATLRNTEVSLSSLGLQFTFVAKAQQKIIWRLKALQNLRALIPSSRWLKKISRRSGSTLRQTVVLLSKIMRSARVLNSNESILVPIAIKQNKTLRLFRVGTLILVVNQNSEVEGCYEITGHNLREFLLSEIAANSNKNKPKSGAPTKLQTTRRLRDAKLVFGRGSIVADLFTASRSYPLDVAALSEFVKLFRHIQPPVKLPTRLYTILDAIEAFAQLYKEANLVNSRDGQASFNLRENGNASFELGRGNAVFRFKVRRKLTRTPTRR